MKQKAIVFFVSTGIIAALIAWLLQQLPPIPLCCVDVRPWDVLKSRQRLEQLHGYLGPASDGVTLPRWKAAWLLLSGKLGPFIYGPDNRLDPVEGGRHGPEFANKALLVVNRDALIKEPNEGFQPPQWKLVAPSLRDQGACECEKFSAQPTTSLDAPCTAFVLDEHHVATASHCIEDSERLIERRFVVGFAGPNPSEWYPDERVLLPERVVHRSNPCDPRDPDFVIVRVQGKIPVEKVPRAKEPPKRNEEVYVVGYPLGLPVKVAGGATVRKNDPNGAHFIANIDCYNGNSGSPVFNKNNEVVGMHVRGVLALAGTCGCLTSTWCHDVGCRGEEITRIDEIPEPNSLYESDKTTLKVEPHLTNQCNGMNLLREEGSWFSRILRRDTADGSQRH